MTSKPSRRQNWRRAFYRIHGWLGINTGLLLFVICFSGSVAVLSNELDWLVDSRARTPIAEGPYDWAAMYATVRGAFPEVRINAIVAPVASGFASVAEVTLDDGTFRRLYLNPYSGELQGITHFFSLQHFFRSFHRWFYQQPWGVVVVTLAGVPLLLSAITGFFFYKGWLKHLFAMRLGRGRRLFWSELHKTSGIWALLFTLVIALTGVFYLVEFGFQRAGRDQLLLSPNLPTVDQARLLEIGPQPALLPIQRYLEAARTAYPGLDIRTLRLPANARQPVYIDGHAGNPFTRYRADRVHLDPYSAAVLGVAKSGELGLVPFLSDAANPIHFGTFGGIWSKALWALLGLFLSFSILTGTYLWIVRTGRSRQAGRFVPGRGARVSVILTMAYFALALVSTVRGVRALAPPDLAPVTFDRTTVGPYDVKIDCHAPCSATDRTRYAVTVLGAGLPNYRTFRISAGADTVTMFGHAGRPRVTFNAGGGPLELHVTVRDGTLHSASISGPDGVVTAAFAGRRPSWPEAPAGVWWVIAIFAATTATFVFLWLGLVVRGLRSPGLSDGPRDSN